MLASGKMVGFVTTKDYEKARAFYEGKLGFDFVSLDQYALVMSVGGHKIRIAKAPNFTPVQGTVLGWEVEDIVSIATWLRDRGVALEKYHSPRIVSWESGRRRRAIGWRGSRIRMATFSP